MYYVLSLIDYEEYKPYWFDCDCSKRKFDRIVRETISEVVNKYFKKPYKKPYDIQLISGHTVLEEAIPILVKKGFKRVKPDYEISIHGMCHYHEGETKPKLIFRKDWWKIIKFNEKLRKKDDRLWKKMEKEEKVKNEMEKS